MPCAARIPSRYGSGDRVALFLPCYIDVFSPHIGQALIELFARLGVRIDYPVDQTCCGQPAFNAGYWPQTRAVAAHFARTFAHYPWIVVPSCSCAAMVRSCYRQVGAGDDAIEVSERVYDLATFLVDVLGVVDVGARFPHRVTYHDGCHGRRELLTGDRAVRLLQAVAGLEYVGLPAIDECCGFGGLFSVKYAELAGSMADAKRASVLETGAAVLTSGDASCLMHVAGSLSRDARTRHVRCMHLTEILVRV
ncbi:MAG: (Fe-S)-binding protein [Candidatus Eremiobacteraeota bacterium]|nr:(Fe-S)-binding protein [Candidatus Eremiobacteraeota bacterium]MBC5827044.1 (Fe-S)-binding protein [Candidatus Eremiobacteraeota bacterium]